ncbi:MAG: YdcF family protein [Vicinamibacterales bacterium]
MSAALEALQDFFFDSTRLSLLVVLVGTWLLYTRKWQKWGRLWLTGALVAFSALSTPIVGNWLASWMSAGFAPLTRVEPGHGSTALVVLAGGAHRYHSRGGEIDILTSHTSLRVLEAARVYRLMSNDPWVVVTGGITRGWASSTAEAALMRDELVTLGVPAGRILIEERSRNTYDHGLYVPELLRPYGVDRYVLVTSGTHMRRAAAVFRARGVTVVPSLAADRADPYPGTSPLRAFLPSASGLELTELIMHELIGTAYYWMRGWI